MRDLIGGGGEGDPAKKPLPSRPDVRFPAASGGRAEAARPAAPAVGEDPGALFTELHVLMAELHDAVSRGASLPIGSHAPRDPTDRRPPAPTAHPPSHTNHARHPPR